MALVEPAAASEPDVLPNETVVISETAAPTGSVVSSKLIANVKEEV